MRPVMLVLAVMLLSCGENNSADAKPNHSQTTSATTGPVGDAVSWKGGQLSHAQLEEDLSAELTALRSKYLMDVYERKMAKAEGSALEAVLTSEAKAAGFDTIEAYLKVTIEEKVTQPTPEEVDAFYPMVARQLNGATLEQARPMIVSELTRRAQAELYQKLVDGLREKADITYHIEYPDLPRIPFSVTESDPIWGAKDAPVTLVQFAEYECPYCGQVNPTLEALVKKYDGKLRVVYKDFPLNFHKRAMPAALAAHCAGDQGKYWEMNKAMLGNQRALSDADFTTYGSSIQLDMDAFQSCYSSKKFEAKVQANMKEGREAGVNGTPAFFINGLQVVGAQSVDRFSAIIDRELSL